MGISRLKRIVRNLPTIAANQVRRRRSEYRYHFIHIPKNGGSSVRTALEKRGDVSLSVPYHYRYIDIADKVGPDLRYFCIVRNPWSRTASRYVFGKQNAREWPPGDPRKSYIEQATFADFVKDQKIFEIPEHPGQPWMGPLNSWFNHLIWIRDDTGKVVCDCLRLEYLDEDIRDYFGDAIYIPRRNVTKESYDYRSMYTDELAEIVAKTFAEDIDYFGFSFDSAASRNIATLT